VKIGIAPDIGVAGQSGRESRFGVDLIEFGIQDVLDAFV